MSCLRCLQLIDVHVFDNDFSVLDLPPAHLLQRLVMLLLNVVLVAIEERLDRVAPQQQERLLHGFLRLGRLVHGGVGQRRSRLCIETIEGS